MTRRGYGGQSRQGQNILGKWEAGFWYQREPKYALLFCEETSTSIGNLFWLSPLYIYNIFFSFSFYLYFFFWDRVSLCGPGWPPSGNPLAFAAWVLRLQMCTNIPAIVYVFKRIHLRTFHYSFNNGLDNILSFSIIENRLVWKSLSCKSVHLAQLPLLSSADLEVKEWSTLKMILETHISLNAITFPSAKWL
jgi:hypothetical protein